MLNRVNVRRMCIHFGFMCRFGDGLEMVWGEREEHKSENWFITLKTCSIIKIMIDYN